MIVNFQVFGRVISKLAGQKTDGAICSVSESRSHASHRSCLRSLSACHASCVPRLYFLLGFDFNDEFLVPGQKDFSSWLVSNGSRLRYVYGEKGRFNGLERKIHIVVDKRDSF